MIATEPAQHLAPNERVRSSKLPSVFSTGNYYMVSLMLDVVGQQLRPEWEPTLPVRQAALAN
jgi:hypothetical protein